MTSPYGNGANPPVIPPQGQPPATTSTKAIAALVCGILSLMGCTFFTGIPAIIIGRMEMRNVDQGLSPASNRNLAKIGYILGIVGTVLSCLVGLLWLLVFGGMAIFGFHNAGQINSTF